MTDLEMYNFLERVTDNFKLIKLRLIETDFSVYYHPLLDEFEDNFTQSDINEAIENLVKNGNPIPYKEFPDFSNKQLKYKVLDVEQLLYPMEFYCCRQFYGLINKFIDKHPDNKLNNLNAVKSQSEKDTSQKGNHKEKVLYSAFKDIFKEADWRKYISAFEKTQPRLLDENWTFLGSERKHKGVVCAWLGELKKQGKIDLNITRQELAKVVNNEIKNIIIGADGKSFDNQPYEYTHNFKQQLEEIIS